MKTVIITGATSGIGKATAELLAEKGFRIISIARSEASSKSLIEKLQSIYKSEHSYYITDLSDLKSVEETTKKISEEIPKIDVLINNAGCFFENYQASKQGYEMQWAVNHLSHFYLTNLLKEKLIASKSRIINVSSGIHYMGKIDEESFTKTEAYSGFKAYGQSKLANVLFTFKLAALTKDTGITVNALHPGGINTGIGTKNTKGFINKLWSLGTIFMKTEKEGAATSVYLASADEVNGVSSKYFDKKKQKTPSKLARDKALADKVWEISKKQCGLTDEQSFG